MEEDEVDLQDAASIKDSITKAFVLNNYITEDFCEFALDYAALVSHPKGHVRGILEAENCNKSVFEVLQASDIAWAVVLYVNNQDYWAWAHDDEERKKRNKERAESRRQREEIIATRATGSRRGAARLPDEVEDDEPATEKVETLWAVGNRSKAKEWGVSPQGRALYLALKGAIKEAGPHAWSDVWAAYWEKDEERREAEEDEGGNARKRKRSAPDAEGDGDSADGGGRVVELDMSDDEDDDGEDEGFDGAAIMSE